MSEVCKNFLSEGEELFGGRDICKSYGKKQVLCGANLSLRRGQIAGLFGLNGSGKSTLMRILSGADSAFSGELYGVNFCDVAYMPADNYLTKDVMQVSESVEFYALFKGLRTKEVWARLKEAGIKPNKMLRFLSTGLQQYTKFLLTVYSGAKVCLLDEPFANLDVNLRTTVARIIIEETAEDRLFLIATHDIKEVETLIDGFVLLKDGKISDYHSAERVREETGKSISEFYREKINEH